MADWMYTEMEEHAKKLETYADLFDKAQNAIDVDQEFLEAIMQIDKFKDPERESQKYCVSRTRTPAINIRSSSTGPPASAEAAKPAGGKAAARA